MRGGTLALFGNPAWIDPIELPESLPRCLCAGRLGLDKGRRFGGCVRVHERWILTAHHVVDVPDLARRFTATFNDVSNAPLDPFQYRLDPELGFFASGDGIEGPSGEAWELDYVFIALAGPYPPADPSIANVARIGGGIPAVGDRAHILQNESATGRLKFPLERFDEHPDAGQVKHLDANYLYYKTSTRPGASGSPVFDDCWNLIALHTTGYKQGLGDPWLRKYNSGTLIARILEDVRIRHPAFPVDDLVTLAPATQAADPA